MLVTSASAPARFVHDPELVCSRGFEWSALRKPPRKRGPRVGLRLGTNVVASAAGPGPPLLSLVKAGLVGTTTMGDPPKPRRFTPGSLDDGRGGNGEATAGIEPAIGVLQTPALTTWPRRHKNGAEDEIRTRDPLLGKEVLYR